MEGDGTLPADGEAAPAPPAWSRFPVSTWVGVAGIGVIVFLLGIWRPAWQGVPGGVGLSYVAAAAGGVLFIAGLTLAFWVRERERTTPVEELPGVEVFRPGPDERAVPTEPVPDEDQA